MAVKGVFASDASIQGDARGDFAAALLQIYPEGSAQLLALSSGMQSENATDTLIHWFEELHLANHTTFGVAVTDTTGTSHTLVDASFVVAGAILLYESSGEMVYVTNVSGNVITVIRGFAGTTANTNLISTGVQKIATAQEEGSAAPTAVANLGYPVFNYCQIFRNAWSVTGTAQAVQYWTGNKVAKNSADAAQQHAEDLERCMLFGKKSTGVKNNAPFRTMDGLDALVKTNVTAAGGTTNMTQMNAFMQSVFTFNIKGKPNERIAFCGNNALQVVNDIARLNSTTFIEPGQTEFGLKVQRWMTPFGNISLMTHPLFTENPIWTKDIRVLHPGAVKTRWLRRTYEDRYDKDGERAGVDADYGIFTSEMCLEYGGEKTAGRLTGLTAAAAG